MFQMKGVQGAKRSDYASTMPVLGCDTRGCKSTVEGNPGMNGKEFVEARAHSLGWHQENGKDTCADCLKAKMGTSTSTAPMSGAAVIGMVRGAPAPQKSPAKGK